MFPLMTSLVLVTWCLAWLAAQTSCSTCLINCPKAEIAIEHISWMFCTQFIQSSWRPWSLTQQSSATLQMVQTNRSSLSRFPRRCGISWTRFRSSQVSPLSLIDIFRPKGTYSSFTQSIKQARTNGPTAQEVWSRRLLPRLPAGCCIESAGIQVEVWHHGWRTSGVEAAKLMHGSAALDWTAAPNP